MLFLPLCDVRHQKRHGFRYFVLLGMHPTFFLNNLLALLEIVPEGVYSVFSQFLLYRSLSICGGIQFSNTVCFL